MSEQGWFDNVGGGAPGALLKNVGDTVTGTVVDQYEVDWYKVGSDKPEVDPRTGQPVKQLVVVLQTDARNWDKVNKVPTVSKTDKTPKPGDADDGKRSIYIRRGTNIQAAIGRAVKGAGENSLANGGTLAVRIAELRDTGKVNPLKVHEAKYEPPAKAPASDGFFSAGSTATEEPPF